MVSKKTAILLTFLLISFFGIAFMHLANATFIDTCRIGSADPYGAEKNVFSPSNDVYANGTGFPPSSIFSTQLVDVWVVNHTTWSDGMKIPSDGILTTVATDGYGNILPTIVWHAPLVPGLYDIVADVDRDGYYNAAKDCLDSSSVQVAAGFFVVPELVLGTVAGVAGCFGALGVYRYSKRQKP